MGDDEIERLLITLDTNVLDQRALDELRAEIGPFPCEIAIVTVTERERGDDLISLVGIDSSITEVGVWGESTWGNALWGGAVREAFVPDESRVGSDAVIGGPTVGQFFEPALAIIAGNSFPPVGQRDELSPGHRRQLRDAMIFDAHARAPRHVLVTNDARGFINDGRRDQLERLGQTRILTLPEFLDLARARHLGDLVNPCWPTGGSNR